MDRQSYSYIDKSIERQYQIKKSNCKLPTIDRQVVGIIDIYIDRLIDRCLDRQMNRYKIGNETFSTL